MVCYRWSRDRLGCSPLANLLHVVSLLLISFFQSFVVVIVQGGLLGLEPFLNLSYLQSFRRHDTRRVLPKSYEFINVL